MTISSVNTRSRGTGLSKLSHKKAMDVSPLRTSQVKHQPTTADQEDGSGHVAPAADFSMPRGSSLTQDTPPSPQTNIPTTTSPSQSPTDTAFNDHLAQDLAAATNPEEGPCSYAFLTSNYLWRVNLNPETTSAVLKPETDDVRGWTHDGQDEQLEDTAMIGASYKYISTISEGGLALGGGWGAGSDGRSASVLGAAASRSRSETIIRLETEEDEDAASNYSGAQLQQKRSKAATERRKGKGVPKKKKDVLLPQTIKEQDEVEQEEADTVPMLEKVQEEVLETDTRLTNDHDRQEQGDPVVEDPGSTTRAPSADKGAIRRPFSAAQSSTAVENEDNGSTSTSHATTPQLSIEKATVPPVMATALSPPTQSLDTSDKLAGPTSSSFMRPNVIPKRTKVRPKYQQPDKALPLPPIQSNESTQPSPSPSSTTEPNESETSSPSNNLQHFRSSISPKTFARIYQKPRKANARVPMPVSLSKIDFAIYDPTTGVSPLNSIAPAHDEMVTDVAANQHNPFASYVKKPLRNVRLQNLKRVGVVDSSERQPTPPTTALTSTKQREGFLGFPAKEKTVPSWRRNVSGAYTSSSANLMQSLPHSSLIERRGVMRDEYRGYKGIASTMVPMANAGVRG
ncbi:hypothetical protein HDV05_003722 [Chytridiales sp. JEL 0842]|nr:hypothetical protein HDV05_003722 [Chytridiales sp. JEL 0842]